MWIGVLLAAAWGCEPVAPHEIVLFAEGAHESFAALDSASFFAKLDAIQGGVGCLTAVLTPEQAARVHAAHALRAFLDRNNAITIPTFQAALTAYPPLSMQPWLPDNHPIHVEMRLAERLDPNETRSLELAPNEVVFVDGHPQDVVALKQPMILQLQRDGALVDSVLLDQNALTDEGVPLPGWVSLAPEPLSPVTRRRLWLGSTAAVTAFGSGALAVLSVQQHDRYRARGTGYEELDGLRTRNAVTVGTSIGLAAVSAGLTSALVLTW